MDTTVRKLTAKNEINHQLDLVITFLHQQGINGDWLEAPRKAQIIKNNCDAL
jgi:hypothetical protein